MPKVFSSKWFAITLFGINIVLFTMGLYLGDTELMLLAVLSYGSVLIGCNLSN